MKKFLLLVCVLIAGCGNLQPKVISTSERTVAVQSFDGMSSAQKLADAECSKNSRFARWISGKVTYIFDCIN